MIDFFTRNGPRIALDPTSVMDIGACVVAGVDLSPKRAIPDDGDPRIDHSLEGFLFTCGPDHIRHPEPIEGDEDRFFPLHGSASASPAIVKSFETGDEGAECVAAIPVKTANGGDMLIERVWTIDADTGVLSLTDTVINKSDVPLPAMMMYHINFGAKHFDDGVRLESASLEEGSLPWRFGEGEHGIFCVPAVAEDADWSAVRLGPFEALGGRSFHLATDTRTLPFLQIWRNQQEPAHILGIEPASHRWTSRRKLLEAGELALLAPGESKSFALRIWFA
ncbi:DUF4432 family protein [Martelella endophytica]|uniref:DUF4432 domain-containing protein n=1 Tax=Martelella endophytica TaxID=1486262 RepID=A0A0D5LRY3_MAREN|nr:DUF4432 family protein [Martelella endophytica]AJY46725.1 hypothetical protein TM49_15260 [Martelella endophytica]